MCVPDLHTYKSNNVFLIHTQKKPFCWGI